MKIKDIENLTRSDIMDMNTKQMEKTLQEITKQVKKRESALKKAHLRYSPALKSIKKGGFYKKTAKDKRLTAERQEAKYRGKLASKIEHGKTFLGNQTSSVRGMRKLNKEISLRIGLTHEPSERFLSRFWKYYDKLKHYIDDLGGYLTSEELQAEIYSCMSTWHIKGSNWKDAEEDIINSLEQRYNELRNEIRNRYVETDVFTLDEDEEEEEDEDEDLPW